MGVWILESCRSEWREREVDVDYDSLLAQVSEIEGYPALIFPDDERFFKPASMLDAREVQDREPRKSYETRL